jgi:amino acid adenylation domain-containing protein
VLESAQAGSRGACVHELIEAQAALAPQSTAAACGDRTIRYDELNARANRLAHLLRRRGVGPDVLVGLLVERSIETLVGLLGILKAGGAYVPLDPEYPADRVSYILDDARAPLLVADRASAVAHRARANATILIDPSDPESKSEPERNPAPFAGNTDLAYVIYTSGSTGRPKGVQIAHKGVVNFLRSMQCVPGIKPADVVGAVTTVSFDIAALELFLPLTVGARVEIVTRDIAADGRRLSELISQRAVTLMQATPATWRLLLDAGWSGAPAMTVLCGGEAMPRELANRLLPRCAALWNMYGPTETTIWSTVHRVAPGAGPVPLGVPIANTSVHVLDESMADVPAGAEGELWIGGDGVARGYLNRPELTAERFIADPFSGVPGSRLYRTGDLARWLPDGALLFVGRRDHQVKIRGFRIELGEIENVLLRDAMVREAAVIAREDARGEKRLIAFVAGREPGVVDTRGVRERLRTALPAYMIPSRVVAVEALPLTPNGKIDRNALAALSPAAPVAEVVSPADAIEARLVRLWEEVLELSPVSVDADFFDIGGDSLHAAALFARIAREFGRDLPVAALVRAPTIERLAGLLRAGECGGWTSLVPFRTTGSKRPIFFVHGGAGTVLFLRELVAGFDPDRPVYGLQSEGQDGRPVSHGSVEEMAALYLAEMRKVQPAGPYLLGGYCFGGIVAFEMARQLSEHGQAVWFVGLVNAPCPLADPRSLVTESAGRPGKARWRPSRGAATARARRIGQLRWAEKPTFVARAARDAVAWRWDMLRSAARALSLAPTGARLFFAFGRRLPKAWRPSYILSVTERAERLYRPHAYAGRIAVIRGNGLYRDPELGWGGLASSIETAAIGGEQRLRRELIATPLVSDLAADLAARLDQAEAGCGRSRSA